MKPRFQPPPDDPRDLRLGRVRVSPLAAAIVVVSILVGEAAWVVAAVRLSAVADIVPLDALNVAFGLLGAAIALEFTGLAVCSTRARRGVPSRWLDRYGVAQLLALALATATMVLGPGSLGPLALLPGGALLLELGSTSRRHRRQRRRDAQALAIAATFE